MAQILEARPGIGALIGQGLGGGIGAGLSQSAQMASQLGLQRAKARSQQDMISSLMGGNQSQSQSTGEQLSGSGLRLTPEKVLAVSSVNPQLGAVLGQLYQTQEKQSAKANEEKQVQDMGQKSFDRMSELLNGGELGMGSKFKSQVFGGKAAEDVGEFESLSGALESMLVDKVSRGTLSNARFKYITETLLPKPNDRSSTIRGKLKGLASELGLDGSKLVDKSAGSSRKTGSSSFVNMRDPSGIVRKVPKDKVPSLMKMGGVVVK